MTMQSGLTFGLSLEQTEQFRAWRDDPEIHKKCLEVEGMTAIGGAITFSFTHTTLGTVVKVSCCVCKTEIDLSDYDNW
jgi:hypothetical protein